MEMYTEKKTCQVFGPNDGSYSFSDDYSTRGDSCRVDFSELEACVERLRRLVHLTAKVCCDWELRGEDERQDLLRKLAHAGSSVFSVLTVNGPGEDITRTLRGADILIDRTSRISIPWEFLYLGDLQTEIKLTDFLGFDTVVGYKFDGGCRSKSIGQSQLLHRSPLCDQSTEPESSQFNSSCGLAEDRRLASARSGRELEAISKHRSNISRLDTLTDPSEAEKLFNFVDSCFILSHFNSHADDREEDSHGFLTAALYVSDCFRVGIDDIDVLPICERSIVVLNCCNGATLTFGRARSLAEAFARHRVSAVVATTGAVDDYLATRWACAFYDDLFRGGSVPESILCARRAIMSDSGNPMGFFYAFLGEINARLPADLHLRLET